MNGNLRVYSATTNPNIEFDADASVNLASTIRFTRSGSVRWNLIGSNGESGTDDFQISRYNNSGVVQGTPLKIIRSTGDIEMSGNLRMYSATTNPVIRFDADAGANLASIISFTRSGSIRWNLIGSNGNSGVDDFNISRYNDSGVFQDSPLKIIRSSGIVELAQALPTASGGTGLTGFSAANRLVYSTSSNALTTLAAAESASALTMDGGAPTWTAGWSGTISFSTDAGDYQITISRGIITNFVFTPA